MNLSYAYAKLFNTPGYSFIVSPDGSLVEWESGYMRSLGFNNESSQKNPKIHLVPGSFNPLHESHKELYDWIGDSETCKFFEMSVERVDKEMVTMPELDSRLNQFLDYAPVLVSRASRFVTKIGTYRNHAEKIVFHVGIDTIVRMADDYGIVGIQGLAANFVVHDRIMNNRHMSLRSEFGSQIPRNCSPSNITRSKTSLTRSSTEIRNSGL